MPASRRDAAASFRSCGASLPAIMYSESSYIILHFPRGCKRYLPAAPLPFIQTKRTARIFQGNAQKLFRARVLTTGQDLAIMYPLLLKAANCICGSAGIGRQARLRGVCCMTYGFKSHLPHHAGSPAFAGLFVFSSDFLKNAVQYTPSQGGDCPDQTNIVPQKLTRCRCVNFLSLHRFPICRSSFFASLESGSQPCSTALLQGGL